MTAATTFGPYQLGDILDRGETGNLVRARDTRNDGVVALKIVCDALNEDAAFRAAFRQQALALRALQHAHIARVLDAGVLDGMCFTASEAPLDGTLRELVRGGVHDFALPQRVAIVSQAAAALAYAHEQGFVHGSVTPDDFWLRRAGAGFDVKLTDFGLGWLAIHSDAAADLWGDSLIYAMPPERCQGLDLDGRSDIYALGVILYELVTGAPPFQPNSLDQAVIQHVYTQPVAPRSLAVDMPEELETVILRCLAKQPSQRFATAGELVAALEPFLPITAAVEVSQPLQPEERAPVIVPEPAHEPVDAALPATKPVAETLAPLSALAEPELVAEPAAAVDQRPAEQARARQNGRALNERKLTQPVPERAPQELIGATVAGFHLGDYLGVSETGDVYRSLHPDHTGIVAVKLVSAPLAADDMFADGFREQMPTIRALRHPNLVALVDAGEADGFLYTAMEWLPDGSVRNLLQQRSGPNAIPLQLGIELARQVAVGLEFVHAQGFVHGCIKPNNLLLERRGRAAIPDYTVKIADLGLAWQALQCEAHADEIWPDTLIYAMPPERCQGMSLDSRADLYALGVILYELATGSVPFEAKTLDTAVYRHVYTQPTPPGQLAPEIPKELEEIILRCLAKRPDDRFATAADLAAALQRLLDSAALAPRAAAPPVAQSAALQIEGPFVPRVSAMDAYGRGLAARELTGEGLRVGRAATNDIVLKAENVAPYHLMLDWDGTSVLATNLAEGGVMIGERAIGRNETLAWDWNAPLRLGPFWMRVEPAPIDTAPTAALPTMPIATGLAGEAAAVAPAEPAITPESGDVLSDRINVALDPQELTLTPGRPATCQVALVNLGNLVDHFTVTVEQVPAAWLTGAPPVIQLNPGAQGQVTLNVLVPQAPESLAGDYAVTIRARSRENPAESNVAIARWTVLPFSSSTFDVRPKKLKKRRRAWYSYTIQNLGNARARFKMSAVDEDDALNYQFSDDIVELDPGTRTRGALIARPNRLRWFGQSVLHRFDIQAQPVGDEQNTHVAGLQLEQKAVIARWMLAVLTLILLGLAIWMWLAARPEINSLVAKPERPIQGEPFVVDWEVRGATSLQLQVNGTQVPLRPRAEEIAFRGISEPVEVHVIAQNMLLGRDEAAILINPVAPTPQPTALPLPTLTPFVPPTNAPSPVATMPPAPTTIPPPTAIRPTPVPPTPTSYTLCSATTTASIVVSGPPRSPYLIEFAGRVVGGGLIGDDGRAVVRLGPFNEIPGQYLVEVRNRQTGQVLRSVICVVP